MASLAQLKRQAEAQSMKALGAYQGPRAAEKASMKALEDRREQTRQQFFKGRPDIPASRLDKRQIQSDLYEKFKQEQMKPVAGTRGTLYQSKIPGGPTLADKAQELAFKYGPTFREIGSDIGYGIRSIGAGLAKVPGQMLEAYKQVSPFGFIMNQLNKATKSFNQKKQELGTKVNALSDIQKEKIANPQNYKLSISKDPELQDIIRTEQDQMTAFDQANIIRQGIEQLETSPVSTTGTPGFKVMPEDQVNLQDIYMQGTKRYEPISVSGTQPMYAGGLESLLPQPIQNLQQRVSSLGETPIGTFGMENIRSGKPAFTYEKDIFGGQLGVKADPFRDQYGFEFSRAFKDGGSVDDKLDNMQKKTNNIYGTGILSAR
jgi:hypothetical protein